MISQEKEYEKWRGISEDFAKAFKRSELYKFYKEHEDELLIGIRNNKLIIYYQCQKFTDITYNKRSKTIRIKHVADKSDLCESDYNRDYQSFKSVYNHSDYNEKKAQSQLILNNNRNPDSKWFCVDFEYAKSYKNEEEKKAANCNPRFDIIALSKKNPHRVALIELKYGDSSIGGDSGIYDHIKDFKIFKEANYFNKQLRHEISCILNSMNYLDLPMPFNSLNSIDLLEPEFYFIILDNNTSKAGGSTPKQKIGGIIFKDGTWESQKISKYNCFDKFGDVTKKSNPFHATFLFSTQTLDNITINDIINGDYDEKIYPY